MKLNLMSGIFKPSGYVTLDGEHTADIQATVPPLPPAVWETEWNEVLWLHGPAQVYPWQLNEMLRDIHDVLIDSGKLIMETPHREKVLASGRPEWVFGDPEPCEPMHMTKWAYTPEELVLMARAAGFRFVTVLPAEFHVPGRDFRIEAVK